MGSGDRGKCARDARSGLHLWGRTERIQFSGVSLVARNCFSSIVSAFVIVDHGASPLPERIPGRSRSSRAGRANHHVGSALGITRFSTGGHWLYARFDNICPKNPVSVITNSNPLTGEGCSPSLLSASGFHRAAVKWQRHGSTYSVGNELANRTSPRSSMRWNNKPCLRRHVASCRLQWLQRPGYCCVPE